MKKYIVLTVIIILILFSSRYIVITKHLEKRYPMSYVYHASIEKVRQNVFDIFSDYKFHNLEFDIGYDSLECEMIKITENENRNQFFINWFGWDSSGEYSEIYYNIWGKLKLIPCYHIFLDSLSINKTKITIESYPKVEAGTDFSLNHMLPYVTSRKVTVKPSTIEEYEIIRKIGEKCKEENMPIINEH